jgi:hypothetical protein
LLRSTNGAQRASLTQRVPRRGHRWAVALAVAVLALTVAVPSAGATTRVPTRADSVALTPTAVTKPWYSIETYYLKLVNCTRTGGWVLADGTCRGYGSGHYSRYVKPLVLSLRISDRVSRPYAKLLAVRGLCTHTADHDPGYRLRRAGYTHWTWGENIGCRDGYSSAKAAVLASHLAFQREKSTNGGHWKNIKNPNYAYIGIGVWRYGTRTRLVTDFYR